VPELFVRTPRQDDAAPAPRIRLLAGTVVISQSKGFVVAPDDAHHESGGFDEVRFGVNSSYFCHFTTEDDFQCIIGYFYPLSHSLNYIPSVLLPDLLEVERPFVVLHIVRT